MCSNEKPGVPDVANIVVILGLVFVCFMAYIISRCFCRHLRRDEIIYDDVSTLERLHKSSFLISIGNRGFNSKPPRVTESAFDSAA